MTKHTLKFLRRKHRKIFKVCLAILQNYAWQVKLFQCLEDVLKAYKAMNMFFAVEDSGGTGVTNHTP